jgi:methylated-DNA-[protein]-cysteine S-methyltransferase
LSPVGILEIRADEQGVISIRIVKSDNPDKQDATNRIIRKTCTQLDEYFVGKRKSFDLPLAPQGTDFQTTVWEKLQEIPYGKTVSYSQLAKNCRNPKACRAVGSANGKNPLVIIIPCHRVIASTGELGGYAYGVDVKKQLLELEKNNA